MADDKRAWCWSEPRSEEAYGPFPSRSAAISDAQAVLRDKTDHDEMEIEVGRVNPAFPEEHSGVLDVDRVLEDMDTHATDNGFCFADVEIFTAKNLGEAQESLDALLRVWAKAHVTSETWAVGDPVEVVRVKLRDPNEEHQ